MSKSSAPLSTLTPKQQRRAEDLAVRSAILAVPGVARFDGGRLGFLWRNAGLSVRRVRGGSIRVTARIRIAAGHAAADVSEKIRAALAALPMNITHTEVSITRINLPHGRAV